MSDFISRENAIDEVKKMFASDGCYPDVYKILGMLNRLPSAESEPEWIPFEMREMTEAEKEEYPEWDYIVDCPLPEDGDEILVSNGICVWCDTFYNDEGCYLDGGTELEGLAWMPLPKPWRKEDANTF